MCAICDAPLTGRQQRYCSPLCSSRAFNAARKSDGRLKEQRENGREKRAEWSRRNGHKYRGKYVETKTCEACGLDRQVRAGENPRTCGDLTCRHYVRHGEWPSCALRADPRGDLRRAVEERNLSALRDALLRRTRRDGECWVWTGASKDGYPLAKIGPTSRLAPVHRAVVEVAWRGDLGKQAAHHVCGNSLCVNPDHLQPVTARDNTAEMLARTYLLSRIADLEEALARYDAAHPLLREIGAA